MNIKHIYFFYFDTLAKFAFKFSKTPPFSRRNFQRPPFFWVEIFEDPPTNFAGGGSLK